MDEKYLQARQIAFKQIVNTLANYAPEVFDSESGEADFIVPQQILDLPVIKTAMQNYYK